LNPVDAVSPVTITGLTNGTLYNIYLKAVNAAGAGTASSTYASVTPITTPAAPTGLSASAGNTTATITFTPPSDGGSAITNYQYSTDGTNYTALNPVDATSPVTITGLTNGTAYTIYLKAVNAAGAGTASSTYASVTPTAPTLMSGSLAISTNYLTMNPGVSFGVNDFIVECWFKNNLTTWNFGLFGAGVNNAFQLAILSNTKIKLDNTATNNYDFSVTQMSSNTWYHVAVVRKSDNITIFLNGARSPVNYNEGRILPADTYYNYVNLSWWNMTGKTTNIGFSSRQSPYPNTPYQTNIANVRMVSGATGVTAVGYNPLNSTITVPTAPLTNVTGTQYLFLGTNITTDSAGIQTVTNVGSVSLSASVPF